MQPELPAIVEKLRPLLREPIGPVADIIKLEALRLELAEARIGALGNLLEKRRQMLWPKDKDMTELDRKTRLEGDTAVYETNYQFLCQLEEVVKDRLELGKLIVRQAAG